MSGLNTSYSVVGVSLDKRQQTILDYECERTGLSRSEVFKHALNYWMALDRKVRDESIIDLCERAAGF